MKEKHIEEMASDLENHTCMSQFQAEIASRMLYQLGYRKQEWISVKDRLPEEVYGKHRKKITVLVCTKSGNTCVASRQRVFDFNFANKKWEELDKFEWSGRKIITHWMPLPEAPKMKGGEV